MVYVDRLRESNWRYKWSCHLFADTNGELHRFAKMLGLKRKYFQDRLRFPHYDLSEAKRRQAVRLGAKEVENRFVAKTLRKRKGR